MSKVKRGQGDRIKMKKFFSDLDNDIRKALIEQLRNLWTHSSTAIEGNTLTLGETAFVLNEGLTVSGKSLKDHEEVVGHAKAIDLLYEFMSKERITKEDLFLLHKAVQTDKTMDIYNPVGAWKVENNGTYHIDQNNKQIFINYVEPQKVPALMDKWIDLLNSQKENLTNHEAIANYAKLHIAFVNIHPFADGNGRMARLLANISVLKASYPPIIISNKQRYDYIKILSDYQIQYGEPDSENLITGDISEFENFIKKEWQLSIELVEDAYKEQKKREDLRTEGQ